MGCDPFSRDDFANARQTYNVTQNTHVTRAAEERARDTGKLSSIVDPAINPIRVSTIRLDDPTGSGEQIVTVGCPMDIACDVDTTASMGGEVDTEMEIFPDLAMAVQAVLPGYDPQFCFGIFGDCKDPFVYCRPQYEMLGDRIVEYLKEMAPQRGGAGNDGEDPQYAMFARAYLTDAYTNRIGLKGYHFIVTDEPCHETIARSQIQRIFGDEILKNELVGMWRELPTRAQMLRVLKEKTHQFALILEDHYPSNTVMRWQAMCGTKSVIEIPTTKYLPQIVSAIIGLTEGTLDITDLKKHLGQCATPKLISQLSNIDIGAQAKLRHALPYPVPMKGDIFAKKGDLWPIRRASENTSKDAVSSGSGINYL